MNDQKIKELISQMTLEEKAGICSGKNSWFTKSVDRLKIPSIMVSDGPNGLRKQDLSHGENTDANNSIVSVCFPTGAGLACSFDRDLAFQTGSTLGEECQAENVAVILGPGANIKRSSLCGRNFEYFSEDPCLSGEIAGAFIQGVQSKNVGTALKHFCMNNQETRRMSVSVKADERTMREIYLASFERAVKKGKPWTVMCSYNKINGVYGSENKKTLTDILRDEWGFEGFVVSDWGAVNDRVKGLEAGLDLEMPSSGKFNDQTIVDAVKNGKLDEKILDQAVLRILRIVFRFQENRNKQACFDRKKDHQTACQIAADTMVLLKNEHHILPLNPAKKIAFIGAYARNPRYQGSGSSHINVSEVTNAFDAASEYAEISYAQGFYDNTNQTNPLLLKEALETAEKADTVVIFAGLPASIESEGFDRENLKMPDCQNELIEKISSVNPNVVVVLHNGAPVEMPWLNSVSGVLEAWLGGQGVGKAEADLLFGKINPSAKLAETFPCKLEDEPSFLNFPGDGDHVEYNEKFYVGYRYYDKKHLKPLFPFGYGLSYTSFSYSNLKLDKNILKAGENLSLSVDVTNTGSVEGKEVAELYIASTHSGISRPVKELKGFEKVVLEPGETKTVHFVLELRDFAYYETRIMDWYAEDGTYDIQIGASSQDIRLHAPITIAKGSVLPTIATRDTTLGDLMALPNGMKILKPILEAFTAFSGGDSSSELGEGGQKMFQKMISDLPFYGLRSWMGDAFNQDQMDQIIAEFNRQGKGKSQL